MAFYRKYRPQVIGEIDNEMVRARLSELLSKDKKDLPHAYLFTGAKGAGKTTAARVVAKIFNCLKPGKNGPCGKCEQCVSIAEGRNLDVLEIDAASNRGIDEIRELRQKIGLAPAAAAYKVYVIDEVHMLTNEAFNALLKTLEEPPAHAVFVLATTDPQKVPATIKSRCLVLNFHRAGITEIENALTRITKAEGLEVAPDALGLIANLADGSFRDAVKYLEQVSLGKGKITSEKVQAALSITEEKKQQEFLTLLAQLNAKQTLKYLSLLVDSGIDLRAFLVDCLGALERIFVAVVEGDKNDLWSLEQLKKAIEYLTRAYVDLRISPLPQLPLELAIVEFCQSDQPVDAPVPQPASQSKLTVQPKPMVKVEEPVKEPEGPEPLGLLTLEKLLEHWPDFINTLKPYNHSVAGVLRSARPKSVEHGIVTVEAFYKFHQEKLSEPQTKQIMIEIIKKLFGEKVKIEIVLGKK